MLTLILALACSDTDKIEETKDWESADLSPLSSDSCPDMTTSGETVQFISSEEERTVTILFPEDIQPKMRILFFYHE